MPATDTGVFTLWLQHGESFRLEWQIEQSDDNRTWTNLATTGYTVLHQIRKDERETAELLLNISGAGYVTLNSSGLLTWDIPKEAVLAVPVGEWFHDVAIVDPSGEPQYLVRGPVSVAGRTSVQGA